MLKKLWHDPVWSKVIAAAIVALAGAGWVVYRKNWWPVFWHGIVAGRAFLFSATPVPHWVLSLLILATLLLVLLLVAVIVIAAQAKTQEPPDWQLYTSDNFYGLKWAWVYEGREPSVRAVLCPHCGYQVGPESTSRFDSRVRFHCDSCGRTVPVEGQSWDSLQSVVIRLIQQKLRNGTYPKVDRPSAA